MPTILLLLLLAPLAPRARGEPGDAGEPEINSREPVFFRDPDPFTQKRIQAALSLLKRDGASNHENGRTALEEIGYWAVDPLRRLLRDGNTIERRNAVLVLGTIRDFRTVADLFRAASMDRDQNVPSFAALMIGKYRDPAHVDRLVKLVRDGRKSHRRRSTVLALTKIRTPEVFAILEEICRGRDLNLVRETATFCMGFFRDQALVRGEGGLWTPCRPLLRALNSSDGGIRRAGLLAVALLGHRDLKAIYLRLAGNLREEREIRRIALLALGRFSDPDVTKLFLDILRNPSQPESVRLLVAMMLKDRRDESVLRALLGEGLPVSPKLKAVMTLALSNFETPESVRKMTVRLTDKSDQVRVAAAIALSRLTDPEMKAVAVQRLTEMLQGRAGSLSKKVKFDFERAREILRGGEAKGEFEWAGNEEYAADLPKDLEERVLDFVNREVDRVLDLANLTQLTARDRFRVEDDNSGLRDLQDYLARYPYFEPRDIPEPRMETTPRAELRDEKREGD